jgi:hypothetical protein
MGSDAGKELVHFLPLIVSIALWQHILACGIHKLQCSWVVDIESATYSETAQEKERSLHHVCSFLND